MHLGWGGGRGRGYWGEAETEAEAGEWVEGGVSKSNEICNHLVNLISKIAKVLILS